MTSKLESFRDAAKVRSSKFSDLVSKNIMEGHGMTSSIGRSISQKSKARWTGVRESLNPINMTYKMLGSGGIGKVAASLVGRNNPELVRHFTSSKKDAEKASKINRYSESTEDTLNKIYELLKKQFDNEKKIDEIHANFAKVARSEDEERFNKLIAAIESMHMGSGTSAGPVHKSSPWLLILLGIGELFKHFWDFFKGKLIPRLLTNIAKTFLKWGKKLLGIFDGFWKGAKKIISKLWDGVKWVSEKFKKVLQPLKEAFDRFVSKIEDMPFFKGIKGAIEKVLPKSEGTVARTAEKLGIKKALTTAAKVGSKTLEGAKGVFKFLTKASDVLGRIPVLGLAIAGTQGYFDIRDSIAKREAGKITDAQLARVVTKELGNLLGGMGGAELGGLIGSFIPIPVVGTLGGALIGGIGGSFGGEWLAGKVFDYFKDHINVPPLKKSAAKVKSAPSTPAPTQKGPDVSVSFPGTKTPLGTSSASSVPRATPLHDVSKQNFNLNTAQTASSGAPTVVNKNNVVSTGSTSEGNSTYTGSAAVRDPAIQKVSKKQFGVTTK